MGHSIINPRDNFSFIVSSCQLMGNSYHMIVTLCLNGEKFMCGYGRHELENLAYQLATKDALNSLESFMDLHNTYMQLTGENNSEI